MTTAQVVETSVTVNNNSPIQDYVHPDDRTQPTFEMTPGIKPFTIYFSFAYILLQLIFEGTRGDNAQGDIALDDVKLVEGPC